MKISLFAKEVSKSKRPSTAQRRPVSALRDAYNDGPTKPVLTLSKN
jgi:hypothetical protein